MDKIYKKNAREKALLEEAYGSVYKESAVDVELDHWWDFDIDDVIRKVYHGAQGSLPPEQGTPEYEENSEKIVIWLKDKYPQQTEDAEDADRTADATAWAKRQNEKQDLEKMPDLGPHSPGHKRFRNPEEIADWAKKHLGEDDEDEDDDEYDMERDPQGRREADPREW